MASSSQKMETDQVPESVPEDDDLNANDRR